jgi:hypothetical protein
MNMTNSIKLLMIGMCLASAAQAQPVDAGSKDVRRKIVISKVLSQTVNEQRISHHFVLATNEGPIKFTCYYSEKGGITTAKGFQYDFTSIGSCDEMANLVDFLGARKIEMELSSDKTIKSVKMVTPAKQKKNLIELGKAAQKEKDVAGSRKAEITEDQLPF